MDHVQEFYEALKTEMHQIFMYKKTFPTSTENKIAEVKPPGRGVNHPLRSLRLKKE
jgi:hypothetical protein